MDLLWRLVEKNKLDINDIPIAGILDQFIEHMERLPQGDMDLTSRFIVFASSLLEIKSRMLLPSAGDAAEEEDPREALVSKLMEYKQFKELASELKTAYESGLGRYFRGPETDFASLVKQRAPSMDELLGGIELEGLFALFGDVMNRREIRTDKVRGGFGRVERDDFTVEEKTEHIRRLVSLKARTEFFSLFKPGASLGEKVVTFAALLEMIKSGEISISQNGLFGKIFIEKRCNDDTKQA